MATAHDCPERHRRFLSRHCLKTRGAAWAAKHGYHTKVDDSLIDEWARTRNGVIVGPSLSHQGRHGMHGEWPVLGAYRRLLAGLRLREQGTTDVRELRLLLWLRGYGGDDAEVMRDLVRLYARYAARARREMALEPEGQPRERTPLRIRRQVAQAAAGLDLGSIPGLSETQRQLHRRAFDNPQTLELAAAIVDRMFRGSHPFVLGALQASAADLPPGLPGPTEIVDATGLCEAALAPDDGSNQLLMDLQRAGPPDLRRAAEMLNSWPRILRWLGRSAQVNAESPGASLVTELCSMALSLSAAIPPKGQILLLAMLTVQSVRSPTSPF